MLTTTPLQPGFLIIHSNRLEQLRELIVAWTKRYPLSVLEPEHILVQSNGIAQWLKLALAADEQEGGCGIAASLDVQLPARFIWQLYQLVLGVEQVPQQSSYARELLTWHLLQLLPELPTDDLRFAPLLRFIANDHDGRKCWQLAQQLAALYDQYQVYRADWLQSWQQGSNSLLSGYGEELLLGPEQQWQPELWRLLRSKIRQLNHNLSRAELHQQFLQHIQQLPAAELQRRLPRRVIIFGISALPQQSLEVLAAIAPYTQVLLAVHNPCRYFWADIIPGKELLRSARQRQQRKPGMPAILPEDQLTEHAHPLLAAWGRQGRDYIRLLDAFDQTTQHSQLFVNERIDLFDEQPASNLLQMLQQDILELRPLHESRSNWPQLNPQQDHSVRFHIAHSPLREVEILHDQLLAAFDADTQLKPRDIMVMVPDIDQYAPYIQAVFGALKPSDPRYIPFTLADLGMRRQQPLIRALEQLLVLPQSRFTVSDVLDLLDVPALQQRFLITAEQLPLLHNWIAGAGIRWGLDAEQRSALQLPGGLEGNSWLFGLNRMLLGYASGESDAWQQIEPYADVGGLEAELLGPLQQFIQRLHHYWQQLQLSRTADEWLLLLQQLLADFFMATEEQDVRILQQLQQHLADWYSECQQSRLDSMLPCHIVAESWLGKLDQHSLQQRFLAGSVNFATLLPMRAIPFKRICLLGMNDGAFPRQQKNTDFDLMQYDSRPGDRSRREDDRYLLLEALLSARQALYISWVGRSIHDNSVRAPSMLIGQLREHLAQGWRNNDGSELLTSLTVEHPLQPFSRNYFNNRFAALFSYQHEWLQHQQSANSTLLPQLMPYQPQQAVTLRQLADVLRDPVRAFYQQRLKVWLQAEFSSPENDEVFALNGLSNWQLQDILIRQLAKATEQQQDIMPVLQHQLNRFARQGLLATGAAAQLQQDALCEPLLPLADSYRVALEQWPELLSYRRLTITSDELVLEDSLTGCRQAVSGFGQILLLSSSVIKNRRYQWRHLVLPWLQHLAANASYDGVTTKVLSKAGELTFTPVSAEQAKSQLQQLLGHYQLALSQLLPVELETSMQYLALAEQGAEPELAEHACRKIYEGDSYNGGQVNFNPYLARSFSHFEQLWQQGRFAEFTRLLYLPFFQAVHQAGKES